MRNAIESEHQKNLITWSRLTWLPHRKQRISELLIHIPNGGSRSGPQEGANLKAQGVQAGFPDLMLFYPRGHYHGLAIELKRPIVRGQQKPSITKSQLQWLKKLNEQGYATSVCYGWQDAADTIQHYLGTL